MNRAVNVFLDEQVIDGLRVFIFSGVGSAQDSADLST